MAKRIIDQHDKTWEDEVRALLGTSEGVISNEVLGLDIIYGTAERELCKSYCPNWKDIKNGRDQMANESLRSCLILRIALNILSMPQVQNIIIDEMDLPPDTRIITKKITHKELKASLEKLFHQQLSILGVEYDGGFPDRTVISKTDYVDIFDYYVDTDGNIQTTN